MSKIFKAEAEGDTMYIGADNLNEAARKLTAASGPIPSSMIRWSEVDKLPEGEELMAEPV
jgi:hypothetical protein